MIFALARTGRAALAAAAVGAYIGAAYWFTSSTSFANPAVTIGRVFSDTFAGIAPASVPPFIAAQLVGGAVGLGLVAGALPRRRRHRRPRSSSRTRPHAGPPTARPVLRVQHLDQKETPHDRVTSPACCSCASTTPAGPRWPPAASPHLAGGAGRGPLRRLATRYRGQPGRGRGDGRGRHRHLHPDPESADHRGREASDVVITMGCGDACPIFPGKRYEDWELDDPAGQGVDAVRPIRDEIRGRIEELLAELLPAEA